MNIRFGFFITLLAIVGFLTTARVASAQSTITHTCDTTFDRQPYIIRNPVHPYYFSEHGSCGSISPPGLYDARAFSFVVKEATLPSTWEFSTCGTYAINDDVTTFLYLYRAPFYPPYTCRNLLAVGAGVHPNQECGVQNPNGKISYTFEEPGTYTIVVLAKNGGEGEDFRLTVTHPTSQYPGFSFSCHGNNEFGPEIGVAGVKDLDNPISYMHGSIGSSKEAITSLEKRRFIRASGTSPGKIKSNFIEVGSIVVNTHNDQTPLLLTPSVTVNQLCNLRNMEPGYGAWNEILCSYFKYGDSSGNSSSFMATTTLRPDGRADQRGQALWYRFYFVEGGGSDIDFVAEAGGYGSWEEIGSGLLPAPAPPLMRLLGGVEGDFADTVFPLKTHGNNAFMYSVPGSLAIGWCYDYVTKLPYTISFGLHQQFNHCAGAGNGGVSLPSYGAYGWEIMINDP